jgi:hypothetical protein
MKVCPNNIVMYANKQEKCYVKAETQEWIFVWYNSKANNAKD